MYMHICAIRADVMSCVSASQIVHWQLVQNLFPAVQCLHTTVRLLAAVLRNDVTRALLANTDHVTHVCTAIRTVHQILSSCTSLFCFKPDGVPLYAIGL